MAAVAFKNRPRHYFQPIVSIIDRYLRRRSQKHGSGAQMAVNAAVNFGDVRLYRAADLRIDADDQHAAADIPFGPAVNM